MPNHSPSITEALTKALTDDLLVDLLLVSDDYDDNKRSGVERAKRFTELRNNWVAALAPVVEQLMKDALCDRVRQETREDWKAVATSERVAQAEARAEQAEARLTAIHGWLDNAVADADKAEATWKRLKSASYQQLRDLVVERDAYRRVLALLSTATPGETPRVAHSKSEYKRLKTMGANVLPPREE